jgi:hypothetical protein
VPPLTATVVDRVNGPTGSFVPGTRVTLRLVASLNGEAAGLDPATLRSYQGRDVERLGAELWTRELRVNDDIGPANNYWERHALAPGAGSVRETFVVPTPAVATTTQPVDLSALSTIAAPTTGFRSATAIAPKLVSLGGRVFSYTGFTPTAFTGVTLLSGTATGIIAAGSTATQAYWIGEVLDNPPTGLPSLAIDDLDARVVHLTGIESITGSKTFSATTVLQAPTSGSVASIVRGASGQSADPWQLQDSVGSVLVRASALGNIGVGTSSFGNGTSVIGLVNAPVTPTANPAGGGVFYAESGLAKWRTSTGRVLRMLEPTEIDVRDYGPLDTPTNTTNTLRAAFAAWEANAGGRLKMPPYAILTINGHIPLPITATPDFYRYVLDGNSCTVMAAPGYAGTGSLMIGDLYPSSISGIKSGRIFQIKHLYLRGSDAGNPVAAETLLRIIGGQNHVVENCGFKYAGTGVEICSAFGSQIRNCEAKFNKIHDFVARSASGLIPDATAPNTAANKTVFSNNRSYGWTAQTAQFAVIGSDGCVIRDCIVEGNWPTNCVLYDGQGSTALGTFTIDMLHVENTASDAAILLRNGFAGDIRIKDVVGGGAALIHASGMPAGVTIFADLPWPFANPVFKESNASGARWVINFPGLYSRLDVRDPALWYGGVVGVVAGHRYADVVGAEPGLTDAAWGMIGQALFTHSTGPTTLMSDTSSGVVGILLKGHTATRLGSAGATVGLPADGSAYVSPYYDSTYDAWAATVRRPDGTFGTVRVTIGGKVRSYAIGASYTVALTDAGNVIEMNPATPNTLTVPPHASVPLEVGTILEVCQIGTGQTTFTPGAGVTLRSNGGKLKLAGQWASASLRQRVIDEWVAAGDLVA